jgi:hypothetical protein
MSRFFFFFFVVLGIESRVSSMLGKCSTTISLQSSYFSLMSSSDYRCVPLHICELFLQLINYSWSTSWIVPCVSVTIMRNATVMYIHVYQYNTLGIPILLRLKIIPALPSMVVHTSNPNTWEAETRGWWDQGQPGLHSEFNASLGYIARTCLNKTNYTFFYHRQSSHAEIEL